MRVIAFTLAWVSLVSGAAAAQTSSPSTPRPRSLSCASASTSTSTPCTTMTIDEEVIEGDVVVSGGVVISPPRAATGRRSLIRLRTDFRAEVLSSVSRL